MKVIHPTAIVESGAKLGESVEIGAYCYVGPGVVIGYGTRLHHHASVECNTVLGSQCEVFPYACLGGKTQDLKFKGGNPGTRIGDRNIFREYVTVHAATNDGDFTTIGNDNALLAFTHIAHDCHVGNHIVFSNGAGLAGHVTVEDHAVMAANSGIHQFCRIGTYAMVAAYSKMAHDVPPFFIVEGQPAEVRAINTIGLQRGGFTEEQISRIKQIYKILYLQKTTWEQSLQKLEEHPDSQSREFQTLLEFVKKSQRGVTQSKR